MSRIARRTFLAGAASAAAAAQASAPMLPTVPLGKYRVTRLIAGGNPVNGFGHSTKRTDELMLNWFTVERTRDFMLQCLSNGINTFQSSYSPKVRDALNLVRERGAKIQWICLTAERNADVWKEVLALKPVAIVHHGNVTDTCFKTNQHAKVLDFVKKIHDAGVIAGISTHDPAHMARIEDSGWENQFYMGCFYNLGRTPEEVKKMVGDEVLGELYPASDPDRMTRRIREVKKQALGFKILAAGRLCNTPARIDRAFEYAYKSVKPGDALVVGMWPMLYDEVKADAELARKYA